MREVYLDYAATTPTDPVVVKEMLPFFSDVYGNPSSLHEKGREAARAVDGAREVVAVCLGSKPEEIIFTSGATESANMAVLGAARARKDNGKHVVVSVIEHHAVLEAVQFLEAHEGFEVSYVLPSAEGLISVQDIAAVLRPDTVLVSVMMANNEIGTIQPIGEIGKVVSEHKKAHNESDLVFHTDASQAPNELEIDVEKLGVDLLTLSGSKVYGPKGVGVLYKRRSVEISPLFVGGGQEMGWRPGTQNVAGIVGIAKALEITGKMRKKEVERLRELRNRLIEGVLSKTKGTMLNGHPTKRLSNNANISFVGVDAETLVHYLDAKGVYISTGSACVSASVKESHVVRSLGVGDDICRSAVRFSLGRQTTEEDIDYVLEILPKIVKDLRSVR